MQLYVLDAMHAPLGAVDAFDYFRWTRRYALCGDFELHAIASADNLQIMKKGCLLHKSDDDEVGFIEYLEITTEDEQEFILVKGRFTTSVLSRRIIWGTENLSGDVSEAVGQLISRHFTDPDDSKRQVLHYDYSAPRFSSAVNTQMSYRNLLSAIETLCETADVGIRTVVDIKTRQSTFTLYRGEVSQAKFSQEYENLNAQTYITSMLEHANVALIGGEGEGAAREMAVVGEDTADARKEIFVDAKDIRQDDFGDAYPEALKQRGRAKLAELQPTLAFDAEVNPHGNLKYKRDFDLGQIVRVASAKWGVVLTARITEIEEAYDRDGLTLQVVFGRGLLTLGQKRKEGA